ncbi:MAG: hypothetical protein QM777_07335 [Pseudorhodoferax sp.]
MADSIGKLERTTQRRVIELLCPGLGGRYLGHWADRPGNHCVGEGISQRLSSQRPEFNAWFYGTVQLVMAGIEGLRRAAAWGCRVPIRWAGCCRRMRWSVRGRDRVVRDLAPRAGGGAELVGRSVA